MVVADSKTVCRIHCCGRRLIFPFLVDSRFGESFDNTTESELLKSTRYQTPSSSTSQCSNAAKGAQASNGRVRQFGLRSVCKIFMMKLLLRSFRSRGIEQLEYCCCEKGILNIRHSTSRRTHIWDVTCVTAQLISGGIWHTQLQLQYVLTI